MPSRRPAPTRTPLDVRPEGLAPKVGSWPVPALLESSGPGFGEAGRWSLFAAHPRLVFEATGEAWTVCDDLGRRESGTGRVLDTLARLVGRFGLADPAEPPDPDAPPFQGGLIGYFGYDLAPRIERLPRKAPRDSALPDVRFALYDTAVAVDHDAGAAWIVAADLLGEGRRAVGRRILAWREGLQRTRAVTAPRTRSFGTAESNFTKDAYLGAVRKALAYIAAGDIFQV
ncbi:MAG: aminodeoxychorismate synthase, component I, partial [Planctomycetia bacterium]|nr:aminodeoxychorismate synthase, component I [Planctomycetia bacterium]